jgi:hypothetical protein
LDWILKSELSGDGRINSWIRVDRGDNGEKRKKVQKMKKR